MKKREKKGKNKGNLTVLLLIATKLGTKLSDGRFELNRSNFHVLSGPYLFHEGAIRFGNETAHSVRIIRIQLRLFKKKLSFFTK